ncbi:hypothetical protein D0N36_04045 [Hymenobacter lapidiphilus]|nr:hypothetical protein D0N36_04045 [Hymenobacter sp. CCM 8763]
MSPAVASVATEAAAPVGLVLAAGRSRARRLTLALLLPTLAAVALLLTVATAWPGSRYFVAGIALALPGLAGWALWQIWRESPATIARRLNQQHPALEDSAALLLQPTHQLNLLEHLQQQRLQERLPNLAAAGPLLPVSFRPALGGAAALLLLAALVWWQRPGAGSVPGHGWGPGGPALSGNSGPTRHGPAHRGDPAAGAAARLHPPGRLCASGGLISVRGRQPGALAGAAESPFENAAGAGVGYPQAAAAAGAGRFAGFWI